MTTEITRSAAARPLRAGRMAVAAALLLGSAACDTDELLTFSDPEFPTDASLAESRALPLLIRGAYGEFYRAYGGSGLDNLAFIPAVALFTDEFHTSDTFVDRNAMDRRSSQTPALGTPSDFAFNRLQRARRAAKEAAITVQQVRGPNDPDLATLLALEGYAYTALAEGYCNAVPISNVQGGEFVAGNSLTTAQLLDSAVVRFNRSLTALPNDLARVGLGRALLNQNKPTEAAAAVAPVPNTFRYLLEFSENTFQNSVWNLNNSNGRFTVADREGGNGLNFRTAGDPRVPVTRTGTRVGFDTSTPLFEQQKYPNRDADIPLADFREARLIEAEDALRRNDVATFLSKLNGLRSTVGGLAPLADPGNPAARVDLLFRERAFWLFATGHRLGDYRRLVKQYQRAVNTVYPIGTHPVLGIPYGNDVVFPVPFTEEQNPNFDRGACLVTEMS